MAGNGPPPKAPGKRARKNTDPIATRTIEANPDAQPELPPLRSDSLEWSDRTRAWWEMWGASPLARDFIATDWAELLMAAELYDLYICGRIGVAAELRLRMAQFGATPESRAKLRITLAVADTKEKPKKPSSRERRGALVELHIASGE